MKNLIPAIALSILSSMALAAAPRNATLKTAGGPLIQAHRGSRCEYQDNAAGGFAWCVSKGIRGFETDVRFTKDHQLVIMHDENSDRTTNGKGKVEELTLAELKQFRLRSCSEPVPTVAEVLAALKGRKDTFIELEMKAYPGKFYTPEVLAEYCRKLEELARTTLEPGTYALTSFNTGTLKTMRTVAPDAPIGLIMGKLEPKHFDQARELGCIGIAPLLKSTTKEMVDQAHKQGFTVCLWMVQNEADWLEAKAKGADRVTSDYPHLLDLAVRKQRKQVVMMDPDAVLGAKPNPACQKALDALKAKYTFVTPGAVYVKGAKKCDLVKSGNDKFAAAFKWLQDNGFNKLDDVVYIGSAFGDGGVDAAIRIRNLDHIDVTDGKKFQNFVGVLLK